MEWWVLGFRVLQQLLTDRTLLLDTVEHLWAQIDQLVQQLIYLISDKH